MPRRIDPWDIPSPDLRRSVCECGIDIPPHGVTPTALWVARHQAHHREYFLPAHPNVVQLGLVLDALRALNVALELEVNRRRDDIAVRDDRIEELEAELDAINRGVR